MTARGLRNASVLFAALLLTLLAGTAFAATATPATGPENFLDTLDYDSELPGWWLRTGAFSSDNITREPDEELDELVAVAEVGANWHSIGSRFALALDGTLAYRDYTKNDFDDEGRANFLAVGDIFIVPDTLDWYVTGKLANAPVDPLGTTSPINVQFVNVVETGPRLTLRPGGSNELTIAASRAEINAEESPIDHTRDTGIVGFMHNFSENSAIGIVANTRRIAFDEAAEGEDFDQASAHLNYERRNRNVTFSLGAGQSRFELADGTKEDETTGWMSLRARRTSDSVVYLEVERELTDTATAMLEDEQFLEQGGVPGFVVTGDPYYSDNALLRYTRGWRAHEWFVALNVRDLDYFSSPLDRRYKGARLGARFALSSRMLLSVTAASTDIDYQDFDRADTVRSLFTELDYRMTRNWSIVTGARYLDRESDDPVYEFAETMLSLFVSYSPRPERAR